MLSLTPPALHSLHSICSGGVSASGGALGLCSLDVCMCQQGGEFWEKWSNKGETCLIFEKLVVHRALRVRVHHFGRVALVREKKLCLGSFCFGFGSWFPRFPSASCMTASSVTSVFEESCFGFWSIVSSRCPCLRESICAWVSDYSWLSEFFCHLLEFFTFLFLFYHFSVFRWCVDNALIKGEIEEREYSILPVMS